MTTYLYILVALFFLAMALAIKLGFSTPLLLLTGQPVLLVLAYWRQRTNPKVSTLHKPFLVSFISVYSAMLFILLVHYEAGFRPSMVLNVFFGLALMMAFLPAKHLKEDH